ncbi:DeoR/GlpR family DNA-binding transcription regulator [Kibdelosporangium phytohabitans]|uniref:DeoR family transcriptional regulator n=1 Tax=Kibdelosporangium phytohabitans TaxID=860235 RepID=A0A0N9HZT1_9PSEU|nr:DeoR/GlpR family DNA-binding transcription regulator [Kibdelosporangium phytohabitans]ALG07870.1 DeoR family transcriptional regulator [Kibdelosporangium phytohabitans]MBE1471203.1 DeoR/GlpR family transcriptional regulator of sugar metabolism [Kibdelosporangium phytohabitans]
MNARERRTKLLHEVRGGAGHINELADQFQVSPSTIRRDLTMLERDGHVVRTYGGAVERSVREKDTRNVTEKDEIALKAAELVEDGELIVLDAGTTTGRLAAHLSHRTLTVVTNGLTAITALAESATVDLIVLGGRLRQPNASILGAPAVEQLRHIGADRVFLGADGLSPERGLCSPSLEQAHLKYAMLHSARHAYVLADHSKLGHEPFSYWTPLDRPHTVVTDSPVH